MLRSEFHYELPDELIARHPPGERSAGRLLLVDGARGSYADRRVIDLPGLLRPRDLLVVNDTRVIPARLWAHKATGGRVEILLERTSDASRARVQLRASKAVRPGAELTLADGSLVAVVAQVDEFWELDFRADPLAVFERLGEVPLPPYLDRPPEAADRERYQTVYARERGSVAAPTAGLHFTPQILAALDAAGVERAAVTLHVGYGTFKPVRVEDVEAHVVDPERYTIAADTAARLNAARAAGRRIVAVGTTTVRALESAGRDGPIAAGDGIADVFLHPGGPPIAHVDALLTNFHLPRSSLLMLVCAFAGREAVLRAYHEAVAAGYRFYSYGDAMLIV